jgi:hypothetical protein
MKSVKQMQIYYDLNKELDEMNKQKKDSKHLDMMIDIHKKYIELFKPFDHKMVSSLKQSLLIYRGLKICSFGCHLIKSPLSWLVFGSFSALYYYTSWKTLSVIGSIAYCKISYDLY